MKTMNRRSFLGTTALGAAALPQFSFAADPKKPLRTGVIGCGWWGMVVLKAARQAGHVSCVAICDVDTAHLKSFARDTEALQGLRPRMFADYREMLDRAEMDFVIIATPPQWHALPFIAACRKGLDIYCEKPLSYDVREGRAMVDAAREAGNVVQVGFQRRHSTPVLEAMDYIQSGQAGNIVQVDAQIHYSATMKSNEPQEPPETLDWDAWCGPAPKLPYTPNIGHIKWRLEKAYGNGHLVDWGIHWIDSIRMTLDESMPERIQAAGGIFHLQDKITTPDTLSAHFEFKTCPVHWRHRLWGAAEVDPEHNNCAIYYGDKATVLVTGKQWSVIPVGKDAGEPVVHEPARPARSGVAHMADFLAARETGKPPSCPVEEGFRSSATVQLGMIAYETGDTLRWDERHEKILGNPDAGERLKREYRAPYTHPYPAG